jgi:hypothetical protein
MSNCPKVLLLRYFWGELFVAAVSLPRWCKRGKDTAATVENL